VTVVATLAGALGAKSGRTLIAPRSLPAWATWRWRARCSTWLSSSTQASWSCCARRLAS